jgi:hypothetical protein
MTCKDVNVTVLQISNPESAAEKKSQAALQSFIDFGDGDAAQQEGQRCGCFYVSRRGC